MKIVFAVVACLAATLICLDAHKSPGGDFRRHYPFNALNGTRGNFSRPASDRYSWNRTLDANTTVKEGASIRNGSEVVVVKSKDKTLRNFNYNESASVYDFSNITAIVLYGIDRRFGPCFLASTDLTYSAVIDALTSRNASNVETASKVSLTANAAPLSREEEDELRESNPTAGFVCFRKPIFRVAPSEANAEPSANETVQVVFFDLFNEVTITYTKRPQFPGPFDGPHFGGRGNGTEGRRPGGPRGGPGGPRGGPGGPRGGPGGPRGGPGGPRGGPGGPRGGPGGPRDGSGGPGGPRRQ